MSSLIISAVLENFKWGISLRYCYIVSIALTIFPCFYGITVCKA